MQASLQQLTTVDLQQRVWRYNRGLRLRWLVALGLAALAWTLTLGCLAMLGGLCAVGMGVVLLPALFHGNRAAFFRQKPLLQAPSLRAPVDWELIPMSFGTLVFGLVVAAPLLTGWAFSISRQRLSTRRTKLETACFLHDYLAKRNNWVPYPPFESQRQAIQVLETLEFVRVSRRFGRLQVRIASNNGNEK